MCVCVVRYDFNRLAVYLSFRTPIGGKLPLPPSGGATGDDISVRGAGACRAVATSSGGYKLAKPSWRCDFCGYETTEARNLRIHMTSEKHAHNLLALQQSAAAAAAAHANMHHQVGPPATSPFMVW